MLLGVSMLVNLKSALPTFRQRKFYNAFECLVQRAALQHSRMTPTAALGRVSCTNKRKCLIALKIRLQIQLLIFNLDRAMKSRITLSLTHDGKFELSLNEAGRDQLVALLQSLDEGHEHFHLASAKYEMDCSLSEIPYRSTDHILSWGKVLFRPDDWDREHYPHVLGQPS